MLVELGPAVVLWEDVHRFIVIEKVKRKGYYSTLALELKIERDRPGRGSPHTPIQSVGFPVGGAGGLVQKHAGNKSSDSQSLISKLNSSIYWQFVQQKTTTAKPPAPPSGAITILPPGVVVVGNKAKVFFPSSMVK